jgi:hypothetical protein
MPWDENPGLCLCFTQRANDDCSAVAHANPGDEILDGVPP